MAPDEPSKLATADPAPTPAPRTLAQAQAAFAAFLDDPQERAQAAASFLRLSAQLAGPYASPEQHAALSQRYFDRLARPDDNSPERSAAEKAALWPALLRDMRVASRTVNASPNASRAHLAVESFSPASDDLRALYTTPEGHTRAHHAGTLHRLNPEARDLYERGATLSGDTLVIPREATSAPHPADQIRLGSLTHAVTTFTPLVGETAAREKAQEFVALGRDISGSTADGDTRLVVFREFYRQVQRDENGRRRTPADQAAQLEVVLANMRGLAGAMREQEWTREPAETLSLEEWERGFETRQRDAEHETHGRVPAPLADLAGPELDAARTEREPQPTREIDDERNSGSGLLPAVSYERIPLHQQPPHLPEGLTPEQEERLRYEVLPALDRQIESGVPPADIYRQLAAQTAAATHRTHIQEAERLLTARVPEALPAPYPTRADEARALYTLQTLGVVGPETSAARNFSPTERAAALDTVGGRLAQDWRASVNRLRGFADLEAERGQLAQQAAAFAAAQRATPQFQALLAHSRSQNPAARAATRQDLAGLLVNPELDRAQTENTARLDALRHAFRFTTGQEISSADEARAALAPGLRRMRHALGQLAAERATLPVERQPQPDQHPNPLYAGTPQARGLRLAVGTPGEYQTLARVAENTRAPVQFYPDRNAPALDGHSETRTQVAAFARAYVAYRLQDPDTRLLNSHRLFREFHTRLDAARTPLELRQTIAEIRQDNYARARFPERFADENNAARQRGEPPRRPLQEGEMRRLLLAPAPAQYTPEMRDLRLDYLSQSRAKAERLRGLADGQLAPSPALQTLLAELARTRSDDPARQERNVRAFLGDYLNPPDSRRPRFSPHNLHELRQQLAPAERDYLYQTITQTRQGLPTQVRTHAPEPEHEPARVRPSGPEAVAPPDPNRAAAQEVRALAGQRVAAYLVAVVRTGGAAALQDPARQPQHTAQVSRLLTDTLREEGYAQVAEQHAPRLQEVAHRLVNGLPPALAAQARQTELAAHSAAVLAQAAQARERGLAPTAPALTPDERTPAPTQPIPALPNPAPASPPRAQNLATRQSPMPDSRYVLRR